MTRYEVALQTTTSFVVPMYEREAELSVSIISLERTCQLTNSPCIMVLLLFVLVGATNEPIFLMRANYYFPYCSIVS